MKRVLLCMITGFVSLTLQAQLSKSETRLFFLSNPHYISDGFDFPVGKPDAKGYYNAQGFGKNLHLGDDWNGKGGGNTDLGDPVYACANGFVIQAEDLGGGWGNVVRVIHVLSFEPLVVVESVYAHLDKMEIQPGMGVKRGNLIGTIGTAGGRYYAHLHFEIRTNPFMDIGGGYSSDTKGFTDPTEFIQQNRTN
ncbi:MAG: M23 family metallopeptidase [Flavobacteriales bacterium]|nr:M23 family metallopeptidase [Flavobacteriales bacterium]